jgi:D-amino-acid dehydrogenase
MSSDVVIIGAGLIGAMSAVHALREGHRVTLLEPDTPGGEQASSYGNAGWLSSHSVIPPAQPGIWKRVPRFLLDPLGPLAIRWTYLPQALPWLLRYLAAGATHQRIAVIAHALRTLLIDAPALHRALAEQAGVAHLIEQKGLLHVYPSRTEFVAEAHAWDARRAVGVQWRSLRQTNACARARIARADIDSACWSRRPVTAVIRRRTWRHSSRTPALGATHASRATGFRMERGACAPCRPAPLKFPAMRPSSRPAHARNRWRLRLATACRWRASAVIT